MQKPNVGRRMITEGRTKRDPPVGFQVAFKKNRPQTFLIAGKLTHQTVPFKGSNPGGESGSTALTFETEVEGIGSRKPPLDFGVSSLKKGLPGTSRFLHRKK